MKSNSLAHKPLIRILPAVGVLLLDPCGCSNGLQFSVPQTPDGMATAVAQTLTAAHSINLTVEASQGDQASSPVSPPTSTHTTKPTLTPTITSTTQGAQAVQPTTSTPSKTPTVTRTTQTGLQKPAAEITSFTTDNATVTRPENANLKWQTKNADQVTLKFNPGGPANVDKTSNSFAVDTTTLGQGKHTLTLTATDGGKTVTQTVTFEILTAPAAGPMISSFTSDKSCLNGSEIATLDWDVTNADTIRIDVYMKGAANPYLTLNPTLHPCTIGYHNMMSGGDNILVLTATNVVGPISVEIIISVPWR